MARYIEIDDSVSLARFTVPKQAKRAYAEFTWRGADHPCLRHDPTSLDRGELVFSWDSNARSLKAGWYVVTLFVDGCPCGDHLAYVDNGCVSSFEGSEYRDSCYECNGLPKADVKCCSTILEKDCCTTELCPRPVKTATENYIPTYEVPDAS